MNDRQTDLIRRRLGNGIGKHLKINEIRNGFLIGVRQLETQLMLPLRGVRRRRVVHHHQIQ